MKVTLSQDQFGYPLIKYERERGDPIQWEIYGTIGALVAIMVISCVMGYLTKGVQ